MASPMPDIPDEDWGPIQLAHVREECALGKLPEWSCDAVLEGRFVACPMAGIASECAVGSGSTAHSPPEPEEERILTLTVAQLDVITDALYGKAPERKVAHAVQSVLWAARWGDDGE